MRILAKTLVSATALAGSLAGASGSLAATEAAARPTAGVEAVSPLAVDQHGLTQTEARWVQDYWGYTGALDGLLGTGNWQAIQRFLQTYWGYPGPIDGIWGPNSTAAFKRFAAVCAGNC